MKLKHNYFKLNRYRLGALVLIVIMVSTLTLVIMKHRQTQAAPVAKKTINAAVQPRFTFTGVAHWRQGPTRMDDMALFHNDGNCFTSIQHKKGTIAADEAEHQKTNARLTDDGYTVTPRASVPATLQTNTGSISYTLSQSSIIPPAGGEKLLGSVEHGYIQLPDSYIYIEANCDTPEKLATTIPALQAIKFDASK